MVNINDEIGETRFEMERKSEEEVVVRTRKMAVIGHCKI